MKKKRVLAIFMAIVMVFCYIPVTSFADATTLSDSAFMDMPGEGFWSTAALKAAVNNKLITGFTENGGMYIKPNDPLTRAQMATIVNRAFGAIDLASLSGASDVPADAWYYKDMQKAVKMGTMKLDANMRPNDKITRQEAFTILGRALKMDGGSKTDLAKFSDASQIADWAAPAMGAMVKAGYIKGDNNLLNPKANMTRAQFAVVMNNVIKEYITKPGTVTKVSPGNVMVNVDGVTLENVTITGDLIIGDGVGEGKVTLKNVIVEGSTINRSLSGKTGETGETVTDGVPVSSITVTGKGNVTKITTLKGTLQMLADVKPTTATNKTVKWSVTNEDGSVTDKAIINANGLLTAVQDGKVKVKATSVSTPAVSDDIVIEISGQLLSSTIVFNDAGPIAKIIGDKPFINKVTGGDGEGVITYTSGTPATATVNKTTGEVTILAVGSTVITATKAATATHGTVINAYTVNVTINPTIPLSTIVFNDAGPIAKIIGDKPFINKVTGGDGEGVITYTSGTPATATVNKTTGEVTILAVGSTVITATKAATATHSETTNTYTINISKKDAIPLTSMSPIVGEAKVGVELTAGSLAPKEATVTYAWLRIKSGMAEFEYIPGATTNKYTPVSDDVGYYIRVAATGIGNYSGIAVSKNTGAVSSSEVSGFAGGSGTVEDPYQVATAKQLDNIRNHLDKHFVQTADINLGVAPWNTGEGWVPIADYKIQVRYDEFKGSYNGDIYKITGLTINSPEKPYRSLFGYNSYKGKLNNVKILNANINGKSSCGTLVGKNEGTINNCYATGYIIGTYARTGGLVGSNSGTIDSSYATTTVDGDSYKGGLVGDNKGTILNCYATGSILSWGKAGGLVGENTGTIDNCYAAGLCEGSESEFGKGGLVGNQVSGKITRSYYDEDTTLRFDTGKGQGKTSGEMTTKSTFIDWDFGSTWSIKTSPGSYPYLKWQTENIAYPQAEFASGSGTESDPYKVSTARELNSVRKHLDKYFIQTADINLDVYPWYHDRGWDQIGDSKEKFTGNYNGNGKRISGLTMHRPGEVNCGLFGYTSETAKISKLGLANVKIEGEGYTGGLVGMNYGTINSCYSIGVVESKGYVIGGLVGNNSGTIISCSSAASVKGKLNVGGLVGINNEVIEKSYSVDLVTGVDRVGGLIGSNFGTITSSYATGDVNGKGNYTGGLIGSNFGTITSSYAKGSVKGADYTGGLVGENDTEGIISKSYATGFVDGSDKTGGFAGANYGNIDSSYATGSVDGGHDTGGLVGFNGRIVTNTYARGSVKGINNVGGLVGSNYGLFLGKDKVYINCSYATGFVEAINTVGKRYEAGLVGNNDGQVNYCYYDKNTTGKSDTGKGAPKTTAEMMKKSTFEVWDFGGTWDIGISPASYPYFKWQGTKNIPTP